MRSAISQVLNELDRQAVYGIADMPYGDLLEVQRSLDDLTRKLGGDVPDVLAALIRVVDEDMGMRNILRQNRGLATP